MNKYKKGRRFEYEFMAMLKANGYEALRTAGSHSPFDIVVVKYTPENKKIAFVAFVQCKVKKLTEKSKPISHGNGANNDSDVFQKLLNSS